MWESVDAIQGLEICIEQAVSQAGDTYKVTSVDDMHCKWMVQGYLISALPASEKMEAFMRSCMSDISQIHHMEVDRAQKCLWMFYGSSTDIPERVYNLLSEWKAKYLQEGVITVFLCV